MISEKFILKLGLTCFFIGFIGTVLVFNDIEWARYIVYPSVVIGAIGGLIGTVAVSIGKTKKDLND